MSQGKGGDMFSGPSDSQDENFNMLSSASLCTSALFTLMLLMLRLTGLISSESLQMIEMGGECCHVSKCDVNRTEN
jgi:hypothetical protein